MLAHLLIYRKNCGSIYMGGFYQTHITPLACKLHVSVGFKEQLNAKKSHFWINKGWRNRRNYDDLGGLRFCKVLGLHTYKLVVV